METHSTETSLNSVIFFGPDEGTISETAKMISVLSSKKYSYFLLPLNGKQQHLIQQ